MSDQDNHVDDAEVFAKTAKPAEFRLVDDNGADQKLEDVIPPIKTEPANPDKPVDKSEDKTDDNIPDKYKNKSVADLITMHQNAESLLGRQSSEVGELRNIVDDFIKNSYSSKSTQEQDPSVDDAGFLDNPVDSVNKLVENHPAIKEAKEAKLSAKQQAAMTSLQRRHPDMQELFADEKFLAWIGDSPYRVRALREANDNFDVDAADEIFGTWKELQQHSSSNNDGDGQAEIVKDEQQQNLNAAKTGNTGTGGGDTTKKIFRRSDIIRLIQTDRPKYEAMAHEIEQAYKEGRVR